MSPSPDPRREHSIEHKQEPSANDRAPSADLPPDVLSEIVAQTASSLAAPQQIDPALQAALVEVARAHAGQPMTVDPAGTALLEAVLRIQFPALALRQPLLTLASSGIQSSPSAPSPDWAG